MWHPLDHQRTLLWTFGCPVHHRGAAGFEDGHDLVGPARRDLELSEQSPRRRLTAEFLSQFAFRRRERLLALDVERARGDLEHVTVERSAILAQ